MKIKKAKMMITGNGINTVTVNGKVKHITELDYITLCLEWTKLRAENNRLYRQIRKRLPGPLQFHQRGTGNGLAVLRLAAQACTA
ncbi:hypothetical protein E9111_23945 [Salmonella enterica subsp. enterica serovar Goldcoast]|nr:hypothetical protein E9111_23945 [Salmonella enterica subsp. enterica serovar Goldcoast]